MTQRSLRGLAATWRRIPLLNNWIVVASVLTAGILAYYSFLGFRYLSASSEATHMREQLGTARTTGPVDTAALEKDLDAQRESLEALQRSFETHSPGALMERVALAGSEAQVSLTSIRTGEVQNETEETVLYTTLPTFISLQGEPTRIYAFLSTLNNQLPVGITDFRMSGLEGTSSAQVRAVFYLSAEPAPEESNRGDATP